ncbi:TetR/AcrR family transcriptional regulator [Williamsia sp. M5A3_1d]
MNTAARDAAPANDTAERLVEAGVRLLADSGPSAIKARAVAAEAGMSSMVVYNYFGGVPELMNAIADRGFTQLEAAFADLPTTGDPVADLFRMALATRAQAQGNPHLYDAMFGLSTRATYRPAGEKDTRRAGRSDAFGRAYVLVIDACRRLIEAERVRSAHPDVVAGALWSMVHGFISLELSDHFTNFDDPVAEVLTPMAITFCVGMGDDPDAARTSHRVVLEHP